MRGTRILNYFVVLLTIGMLMLVMGGCKPKVARTQPPPPPPPSTPPAPTPTISLEVSPSAIEQGQSATLRWSTTNAQTVTIEPEIGTAGTQGSRTVSPNDSTTYRAVARNRDKTADATARLTVTAASSGVTPPKPITDIDSVVFGREVQPIFFDYDKYDIRSDARETLRKNAQSFQNHSQWMSVIEGHCDERGTEEYNMALGDRRATVAKETLISLGIAPNRLTTISYGKSRPFDPGHNEEAWARNRRAQFVRK